MLLYRSYLLIIFLEIHDTVNIHTWKKKNMRERNKAD